MNALQQRIGDFWNLEETLTKFDEPDDNSLFLIHTECGKQLFNKIIAN